MAPQRDTHPVRGEDRMDAQAWENRYRGQDRLFSGNPNATLVAEAAGLSPGKALDLGSGEGADAIWLAQRGWHVTAIDVSQTALDRAAAAAGQDLADRLTWTVGDLNTTRLPAGAFDLVSAHYVPLPRRPGPAVIHRLLDAVAPGGTLLIVNHNLADLPADSGFDPADYYEPADIGRLLGTEWTIRVDETRRRAMPAPAGTNHSHDTVLRAQRR